MFQLLWFQSNNHSFKVSQLYLPVIMDEV